MTKTLVIQIPCYNEAKHLPETLADLPRTLPGIDRIIVMVIDDGSSDNTAQVALENGVDYVVRHRRNRGLARTFITGLRTALSLGADIVVNTDADHQYPGKYIAELVQPIVEGKADVVIGDRQPGTNIHFSPIKQRLETLGSRVISILAGTEAPDAPSGFRAYSRFAVLRLQVYNEYSYTLETIIQAGRDRLAILHVPMETNPSTRPSRLHKGMLNFIWRQSGTIIRSFVLYQPLKTFIWMGIPFLLSGLFLILRFMFFFLFGETGVARNIQSVSIGGTLFTFGFMLIMMGLIGDSLRANRQILEEILIRLRDQSTPVEVEDSEVYGSPISQQKGGEK